jgi:uncharacterized UBP type Zn finger protein
MEERKRYIQQESKMSGIVNTSARCYIISVMQALYMTRSFPDLVKAYENEYKTGYYHKTVQCQLLDELKWLMDDLKEHRKAISTDRIKAFGPIEFQNTEGQQDCHEYLSALFEFIIEKELALVPSAVKVEFTNKFKSIFEITIRMTIVCEKCRHTITNDENSYIHSIDYK